MSDILEYKCPSCGGAMEFDSATQRMKCPYCDTEMDMKAAKAFDQIKNQESTMNQPEWEFSSGNEWNEEEIEDLETYICESCGGEIIAQATTGAMTCPFCDNQIVIAKKFSKELRPDFVIPFQLDKKAAKAAYKNYLKGKILLPKVFKDENHIDEIKGIYVPFWLFDSDVDANIYYHATRTHTWSDSNYHYTRTSHYSVYREGTLSFSHVPVDGASKMEDELMESIEPFDFSGAVDFQTAYLAGYLAEKYDVSMEECIGRANERIKESTQWSLKDTVKGYTSVIEETSNINLSKGKTNYALYPVWILNTSWKGEKYVFAMNGQTGKITGNLPIDKKAFLGWFFSLTGVFSVLAYALLWFLF